MSEYKEIGEIANYRRGSFPQPYTNSSYYGGDEAMPFIQVADIEDTGFLLKKKTKQTISKIAQPKSVFVEQGTVICSIQGTIGRVAITQYNSYVDRTIAIFESFKIEINKRYFAYCIQKKFEIEKQFARGSTLKTITKEEFTKFKIAVPPLEVQHEIVHILDDFTLLSAELSAELKARQVQYEYYRDKLLENKNKTQVVFLEDILKIKNGKDYKHLGNGDIPVYGTGGIMTYVNQYSYNKPSVLIPRKGSLDKLYYVDKPFWNVDTIFYTEIDESKAIPKYIYYYLQNEHLEKLNKAGGVPSLTQTILNKIKIVLPNIKIQNKIINVLDNFDTICSDLKIGLPAEIEARQKQYEFYRDTLLTYIATGEIILQDKTRQAIIKLIQYVFGYVDMKLEYVVDIYLGLTHTPKYVEKGIKFISAQNTSNDRLDLENVKYISEEEFNSITDNAKPKRNDVLFTRVGSNLGHPVIIDTDEKLCIFVSLGFFRIIDNEVLNNKFLKYWLNTEEFWKQVRKNVHGSAKINLNTGWLKEFKIKIPCIYEQNEIVNILEKLEKITNDIQEGLPSEIEARQKQYEYYRDKLLTFKELEIKEE